MILVVDMNCRKDSLGFYEFVLPLVTLTSESGKSRVRHFTELTSADINECSSIILSGTPLKDNATLSQPEKFEWIKTLEKPLLGICAGMQTIGLAFNLALIRCLAIGMTQITTLKPNPLFSGKFKAYALHNFSVIPSNEFEALAESKQCVHALKHKQRDIYCVLFHPEARNKEIIERFIHMFRATEGYNTHTNQKSIRRFSLGDWVSR